jgi:hypothetical protein
MTESELSSRQALEEFVKENAAVFTEEEALTVLRNVYCTPQICSRISRIPRLTGLYSVRLQLVAHRQTPQAHAVRLVHYLYWLDLLRLSIDVRVSPPIRRAIETELLLRVDKLTLGERVSSARRCGQALIKVLLFDPHRLVFEALLVNARLKEEDVVLLAGSPQATPEQLTMLAHDPKWSSRHAVRRALVLNPRTPKATAASQLRHLSGPDLRKIHSNPAATVYIRRCIERMLPVDFPPPADSGWL